MIKDIAVIVGLNGLTVSFFEPGMIKLYKKENGEWNVIKELPFSLDRTQGVKAVRESLAEMVAFLDGAKAIAGREISGIPYNIFDAAGFNIFEIDGKPEDFLDDVSEMQEENEEGFSQKTNENVVSIYPLKTDIEGKYHINLKELQIGKPGTSSKQALLPFLKSEKFYELEVICDHIPPWFDTQLDKLGLKFDFEMTKPNEFKVSIYHKICSEE